MELSKAALVSRPLFVYVWLIDPFVTNRTDHVNMADIKAGVNQLFLREEELRTGMELLFYAYREFTAEPDEILAQIGFGRAHHRVIYFVGRYPKITVSELLAILKITKQSLSRVLGELVRQEFIQQQTGVRDRRQRLLELTEKGVELERQLSETQRQRIARAYRMAGAEAVEGFRKVMLGMMDEEDRVKFTPPVPARLAAVKR
ncbi:DNA-binding MarR family transcriptional regulator [Azospirillum brasilense]|nr:DNA-binding MarR family transcriptional regulator [Azospirillum brasilense]